jgi:sulfite dehydrogenase
MRKSGVRQRIRRRRASVVGLGLFGLLAIALPLSVAARAQVRSIVLPAETVTFRPSKLAGYELARQQCSSCHSAEYVLYQPTSARPYWQATVDKMVKTFGAPIPADQIPPIVDYLVATYGPDAPTAVKPASPEAAAKPARTATPPKARR